jgi:hypothetical protein
VCRVKYKRKQKKINKMNAEKTHKLKIIPLFIQYIPIENSPGGGTVARDVTASL